MSKNLQSLVTTPQPTNAKTNAMSWEMRRIHLIALAAVDDRRPQSLSPELWATHLEALRSVGLEPASVKQNLTAPATANFTEYTEEAIRKAARSLLGRK